MGTRLVGNAVLGVVCALGVVFTAVSIRVSWGGSYWVFGAAIGVVLAGCALVRHRFPLVSAGVGIGVAGVAIVVAALAGLPREPGPVGVLALGVLVATVVRRERWGSGALAAAGGLIVVGGSFAAGGVSAIPVLNAVGFAAGLAAGLGLRALDARRRAAREAVRREERLELARELHDVVAHHITGIVLQAQAAQLATRRAPAPAPVRDALAGIETAGTDALAAMRRVVGVLRDPDDAGTVTAENLDGLLDRFAGRGGPRLLSEVASGEWPPEVTSTVYRVVQEALTNVSRHAPGAATVSVVVGVAGEGLVVEVTDDAPPAAPRYHRTGYGLVGMRERVESLGGTLTAAPREACGWAIRATIPL